jgi:hypothetical protein
MRLVWGAALVTLLGGCGGGGAPGTGGSICTLIACVDQFAATLHDASGGLPNGKQVLTVVENGMTTTCSFTLPRTVGAGQISTVTCPKGLQLQIMQAQMCQTSGTGQYQTTSCKPIAGKYTELLTITGSPTTIQVTQTVDGATWLDQTVSPTYMETRPNGPNCEPVCSQASADWTLAPP